MNDIRNQANKASSCFETCDLLGAHRIYEILCALGRPETGGGVRGARARGRSPARDHRPSPYVASRCECRSDSSAPKPLPLNRRIIASFVSLLFVHALLPAQV